MNVILVLIDSLNRHALSCYGDTPIQTPNIDAFAERACRFDNHFAGSMPCMPARRELYTGRREMMWRPWGPLEPFDHRLPRLIEAGGNPDLLSDSRYATAIVTDHYHYWEEPGNGYLQCFQSTELIRGHEVDNWHPPVPQEDEVPGWVEGIETSLPKYATRRYYANVQDFETEEDFFAARVFSAGCNWLQKHAATKPFFLQIESFDVHEPFHVPEPYASMYSDESLRSKYSIWPPYSDENFMQMYLSSTPDEGIELLRAQYAGKVTMTDRWFGEFLNTMDELNLWENTMVIVTTDHGHDLGEHNKLGKQYPHYDTHAHIPLLVWHPHFPGNGRTIESITSTVDLFATTLDAMDVPIPDGVHSQSIMPLVRGEKSSHREATLYGTFGQGVCCTDGEWTLFKSPVAGEELFSYSATQFKTLEMFYMEWMKLATDATTSLNQPVDQGYFIPGAAFPQWKMPIEMPVFSYENYLFNRVEDPGQEHNLWEKAPEQRTRMLNVMRSLLKEEGAPPEQYIRLGLKEPE